MYKINIVSIITLQQEFISKDSIFT